MSQFTTPLILEHLPNERWMVSESFEYHVGKFPSLDIIVVPKMFITDITSVPRFLWSLLPPHGEYGKAAVIHDFLYREGKRSRKECDKIFLEGMEVLGVNTTKRKLIYLAVRIFGKLAYKGA